LYAKKTKQVLLAKILVSKFKLEKELQLEISCTQRLLFRNSNWKKFVHLILTLMTRHTWRHVCAIVVRYVEPPFDQTAGNYFDTYVF